MIIDIDIATPKRVEKKWGYEMWIHNDNEYCGKLLVFTKNRNRFSMHYHIQKKESWYVQEGRFQFNYIDVENGKLKGTQLEKGQSVTIERGQPHQLIALEDNSNPDVLRYYAKYSGLVGSSESMDYLDKKLKEYYDSKRNK